MCFGKQPSVPVAPPVPSKDAEDAQRRRANEAAAASQAQGRAATVITSPLGDPNYGNNVLKTKLGGF